MSMLIIILLTTFLAIGIVALSYTTFLVAIMVPSFQSRIIYYHRPKPASYKTLNEPEAFGFLHRQVTPFYNYCGGQRCYYLRLVYTSPYSLPAKISRTLTSKHGPYG